MKEIKMLGKVFNAHPESLIFARYAEALLKEGRADEAISICEQGLEKHPDYGPGYGVLAEAYEEIKDSQKADEMLALYLKHDPHNPLNLKRMGLLHLGKEQNEEAAHYLNMALAYEPANQEIRTALESIKPVVDKEGVGDAEMPVPTKEEAKAIEKRLLAKGEEVPEAIKAIEAEESLATEEVHHKIEDTQVEDRKEVVEELTEYEEKPDREVSDIDSIGEIEEEFVSEVEGIDTGEMEGVTEVSVEKTVEGSTTETDVKPPEESFDEFVMGEELSLEEVKGLLGEEEESVSEPTETVASLHDEDEDRDKTAVLSASEVEAGLDATEVMDSLVEEPAITEEFEDSIGEIPDEEDEEGATIALDLEQIESAAQLESPVIEECIETEEPLPEGETISGQKLTEREKPSVSKQELEDLLGIEDDVMPEETMETEQISHEAIQPGSELSVGIKTEKEAPDKGIDFDEEDTVIGIEEDSGNEDIPMTVVENEATKDVMEKLIASTHEAELNDEQVQPVVEEQFEDEETPDLESLISEYETALKEMEATTEPAHEPSEVETELSSVSTDTSEDKQSTLTMAEIYAKQGHLSQAITILEDILERDPDNETVLKRLEEMKQERDGQIQEEDTDNPE